MKIHRYAPLFALVTACTFAPGTLVADEPAALAVLASSEASLQDKAMACDELGRIGTAQAVPVLAKLLADEKLHDYARDGLERIVDPAAGKALLAGLKTLKGSQRVGVIITLGDRKEKAAVPALARIAKGKGTGPAAGAALASLAQIGTDEATKTILAVLAKGAGPSKLAAAKAALAAAQRMEQNGSMKTAGKLRKAVAAANVPAHLKQAAGK